MKNRFFSSLAAGQMAALTMSLGLSLIFMSFYSKYFDDFSFLVFLGYFSGHLGIYFMALSAGFFLVLGILGEVFGRPLFKRNDFGLFLSGFIAFILFVSVFLFVNFNVLRFSRELKSYVVNLVLVVLGIFLFILIYKLFPLSFSLSKYRALKYASGMLSLIFVVLFFIRNPFGLENFTDNKILKNQRNYESSGNYLYNNDISVKKLNIILLSIDTLRQDGLSCYGNPIQTSPHIDALSKDSILFKNVFSQSSWTLPSHMTMITSLYPSTHGCTTSPVWTDSIEKLDEYWITLAEILKQRGYRTAAFSDGELLGPKFNFDQGFEVCDDSGGGIKSIAQKAISWIENLNGDSPFFLFMHCYDVHNYRPPIKYEQMFVGDYDGKLLKYRKKGRSLPQRVTANAFYNLSDDDISYLRALYNAEILATDTEFGKVLDHLKSEGLYEEAIIIVTSDHGEEFWEHKGTGHGWSLHQHQLKVPLIWKSPLFQEKGTEISMSVGLIDIYPTLLEELGIPIPFEVQGLSLTPYIRGQDYPERSFLAEASHLKNQKGLIKDGHSYLHNSFPPIGENLFDLKRFLYVWRSVFQVRRNALYDLHSDPGETNNIIVLHKNKADQMKREVLEQAKSFLLIRDFLESQAHALDKKSKKELRSLGYIK